MNRRALPREQPDRDTASQFMRYSVVGVFNTLFGYLVFALFNLLMVGLGRYSYLLASISSSVVTISVAFFLYKWFVFRTRGNYLIELIRCFGIYGTSVLIGLAGLAILVPFLQHHLKRPEHAAYFAGAIMTGLTVLFSFLGHKNISFRQRLVGNDQNPPSASRDSL
ncbi:MAG TPA: GtrA family protein [Terracidiphilus sp.]|jgi:putative flippase GtrA